MQQHAATGPIGIVHSTQADERGQLDQAVEAWRASAHQQVLRYTAPLVAGRFAREAAFLRMHALGRLRHTDAATDAWNAWSRAGASYEDLLAKLHPERWSMTLNAALQGVRVLAVDDDPCVGRAYARVVWSAGGRCEVATNTQAALNRLDQESFDVLVSDHHRPGSSGLSLLGASRVLYPDLPLVLHSGGMTHEVAPRGV